VGLLQKRRGKQMGKRGSIVETIKFLSVVSGERENRGGGGSVTQIEKSILRKWVGGNHGKGRGRRCQRRGGGGHQ